MFVGSFGSVLSDDFWKVGADGIQAGSRYTDISGIFDDRFGGIKGWVRSSDGLFYPVVHVLTGEGKAEDGTPETHTVITGGYTLDYLSALRAGYSSRQALKDAIERYNDYRYPDSVSYPPTHPAASSAPAESSAQPAGTGIGALTESQKLELLLAILSGYIR